MGRALVGAAIGQVQVALAMRNSKSFIVRFWRARDGATTVEYALVLAIVCCGIAVGASMLAGSINEAVTQLAVCLEQPVSCLAPS